jgi:hypothetical protein
MVDQFSWPAGEYRAMGGHMQYSRGIAAVAGFADGDGVEAPAVAVGSIEELTEKVSRG